MFRTSESFTEYFMTASKAQPDVKYMPDQMFYQQICLILCDLFGYRAELSEKQFFEKGSAERKMIFVLSIYDIIKSVRKGIKINTKLTRVDKGAPHASDETNKEY